MSFFRGTSVDQDSRYFSQNKKLLAKMSFPKCFGEGVDLTKVQREVINQWVTERITQILGFEDDIVVSLAINLLEPKVDERLDPRQLQIALTGFLEKAAAPFTQELWELLLSAQANPTGIPTAILDKKKQEMEDIAAEKDKLRQVLEAKRAEIDSQQQKQQQNPSRPHDASPKQNGSEKPVDATNAPSKREPPQAERRERRNEPRGRSRSLQRRPRSPPPRRRGPPRRSRSPPRGRSRRFRSRSPSVKRRPRRRSPSRDRHSRGRGRSERRSRERSRRSRRSPSLSPSPPRRRRRSASSSLSRSPRPRRRRSPKPRRSRSRSSESGSDCGRHSPLPKSSSRH